jgi:hypothetical protein
MSKAEAMKLQAILQVAIQALKFGDITKASIWVNEALDALPEFTAKQLARAGKTLHSDGCISDTEREKFVLSAIRVN